MTANKNIDSTGKRIEEIDKLLTMIVGAATVYEMDKKEADRKSINNYIEQIHALITSQVLEARIEELERIPKLVSSTKIGPTIQTEFIQDRLATLKTKEGKADE